MFDSESFDSDSFLTDSIQFDTLRFVGRRVGKVFVNLTENRTFVLIKPNEILVKKDV